MSERDVVWRKRLAERISRAYVQNPSVGAVLLAGSVARGTADRFSDLEIHVFWLEPPGFPERLEAARRAGGEVPVRWDEPPTPAEFHALLAAKQGLVGMLWPHEENEWSDKYYVREVQVDVSGFLTRYVDEILDETAAGAGPTDDKQMLFSSLADGLPLAGPEVIARWRSRLQYPESWVRIVLSELLKPDKDWLARHQFVVRAEDGLLHEVLLGMQRRVLRILLALNRRFLPDPRLKWVRQWGSSLEIAPRDLGARLSDLYCSEPAAAVASMESILEETWDLIDAAVPGLGIETERWFRFTRPAHDAAPEGI